MNLTRKIVDFSMIFVSYLLFFFFFFGGWGYPNYCFTFVVNKCVYLKGMETKLLWEPKTSLASSLQYFICHQCHEQRSFVFVLFIFLTAFLLLFIPNLHWRTISSLFSLSAKKLFVDVWPCWVLLGGCRWW